MDGKMTVDEIKASYPDFQEQFPHYARYAAWIGPWAGVSPQPAVLIFWAFLDAVMSDEGGPDGGVEVDEPVNVVAFARAA